MAHLPRRLVADAGEARARGRAAGRARTRAGARIPFGLPPAVAGVAGRLRVRVGAELRAEGLLRGLDATEGDLRFPSARRGGDLDGGEEDPKEDEGRGGKRGAGP